ncbi:presqualene diphosphate synthase HpnD [Novosphingobium sp. G106]|uniref:presqualene diphosphate synthase HpnD n=1 Tax=Novosphingobium sp. G106 TaxID=2849500 RepID=UPI001C2CE2A3|nr:presqualene diphosphate synthase HpnD [Novosphingobium sp. G106]MBV1688649.1 presqualene diphosphate synthase HpnD [Novosphingobium sp. G106]
MSATITASELRARVSGSSFYAGMRILPKAEREAMFAIYGFCRLVDDIADDETGEPVAIRQTQLDQWRRDIDGLYAGDDPGQAAFLAEAVRHFHLDRADFLAVIDGMQMDLDRDIRWPDFAELDLYCDRVASAVGRLSVRVFGMDREPGLALAHHLGRALQFTNILRDIDEDAGIGRVYLPGQALAAAGIVPTTPAALVAEPELDAAARWLAARAEVHFSEAGAILAERPRGHLIAPRLMEVAYSRLLDRMTRQGWRAPRKRVRVSKLALLFSILRFSLLP